MERGGARPEDRKEAIEAEAGMNERTVQAAVRFGRVVVAAAVSAGLLVLGDLVTAFELEPPWPAIVLVMLTAILNAIGKFLRGEDDEERPAGGRRRRERSIARMLPI